MTREINLQVTMIPELEQYLRLKYPGKSLPEAFRMLMLQVLTTVDLPSYSEGEEDPTSGNYGTNP